MRHITIEVDGVTAVAELLETNAPQATAALWETLPITTILSHTKWSGAACGFRVESDALRGAPALEHPVCSIYPGNLVARPDRGVVLLSYGQSEYRSNLGVEYATRVGRLIDNSDVLLAVLGRMHSEGDKKIQVRRQSDAS